ncbi:MAG: IS701 family transposase, partial [Planctomycetaceae bacterium]
MSLQDIAKLGQWLGHFLVRFADCFARPAGRKLLRVFVRGLLSDVPRKNVEAIALNQSVAP